MAVGCVLRKQFVLSSILIPAGICPSFSMLLLFKSVSYWLPASQVSAFDHVVGTTCGRRGRDVRRFTSGEENDATEQKALTLLNRKVTAQLEVNSSC
jgi:hypothetical protein